MGRLILICEGDAHTVEYFHNNGVYPGAVVFTATRFREMSPYLTKDDEVLVVLKGLTDFTMAEVYALIGDLEEKRHDLKSATVMSNLNLGKIDAEYYKYTGDLFYGGVVRHSEGKVYDVTTEKLIKKGKLAKTSESMVNKKVINSVMSRYGVYDKRSISSTGEQKGFKIYGKSDKRVVEDTTEMSLMDGIITVDLFTKN